MSTQRSGIEGSLRRALRRGAPVGLVLLLGWAGSPIFAQSSSFHPEVRVDVQNDDNVTVSEDGSAESEVSQRVSVRLPWVRTWDTGQLSLSYEPSYERFQDRSELDNDGHRLDFAVSNSPTRTTGLSYDLTVVRTQVQGLDPSPDSSAVVAVTGRIERDTVGHRLAFQRRFGSRAIWDVELGQQDYRFTVLDDVPADPSVSSSEDRSQYGLETGLRWNTTRRDTVGFSLAWDRFDLDLTGTEDVAIVRTVWSRVVQRGIDLEVSVGAARRDPDFDLAQVSDPSVNDPETEAVGELRLTRSFRRASLSVLGERRPSPGGALAGTATDSTVRLSWSFRPNLKWTAGISAGYGVRDATVEEQGSATTRSASASLEWQPSRKIGLSMRVDFIDQTSDDVTFLNRSQTRARIGVVWYPNGPRPVAEGGPS